MSNQKQNIYFFVDDSGVLHSNAKEKHFIYGGYIFVDKNARDNAKILYTKF